MDKHFETSGYMPFTLPSLKTLLTMHKLTFFKQLALIAL